MQCIGGCKALFLRPEVRKKAASKGGLGRICGEETPSIDKGGLRRNIAGLAELLDPQAG